LFRATCSGATDQAEVLLDFEANVWHARRALYATAGARANRAVFDAGDRDWSELGYMVDTLTVPGDHREMLTGDNAAVIARHLVARLEAIRPAQRAASA